MSLAIGRLGCYTRSHSELGSQAPQRRWTACVSVRESRSLPDLITRMPLRETGGAFVFLANVSRLDKGFRNAGLWLRHIVPKTGDGDRTGNPSWDFTSQSPALSAARSGGFPLRPPLPSPSDGSTRSLRKVPAKCPASGTSAAMHGDRRLMKIVPRLEGPYTQGLLGEHLPPQCLNCSPPLGLHRHVHEPVSLRLAGLLVPINGRGSYSTEFREHRA